MAGQHPCSDVAVYAEALSSRDMMRRVVLVRSAQSIDRLPEALRNSNVIKMTVAEAKGLEFDDVFLLDFFNDSPAQWRNLNNFVADLEGIEETQGWKKLPAGSPLVDVTIKPFCIAYAACVQQCHTQSSINSLFRPCNAIASGLKTGKGAAQRMSLRTVQHVLLIGISHDSRCMQAYK